jgi:hypothetical protein
LPDQFFRKTASSRNLPHQILTRLAKPVALLVAFGLLACLYGLLYQSSLISTHVPTGAIQWR